MPPRRGNPARPQHTVAMPNNRWNDVGVLADAEGTDRTALINAFFAWYRREPGAKRPTRPAAPAAEDVPAAS